MTVDCASLSEARAHIDEIDHEIIALLADRGAYVTQAARFKKDAGEVKAPQRVEQVIDRVKALAEGFGADPDVAEHVYRAMIAAFIRSELAEHEAHNHP